MTKKQVGCIFTYNYYKYVQRLILLFETRVQSYEYVTHSFNLIGPNVGVCDTNPIKETTWPQYIHINS